MIKKLLNLLIATLAFSEGLLAHHSKHKSDISCNLRLYYTANPNILNETITEMLISQIATCIDQTRKISYHGKSVNSACSCNEFMCAVNCMTYMNNNVSSLIF